MIAMDFPPRPACDLSSNFVSEVKGSSTTSPLLFLPDPREGRILTIRVRDTLVREWLRPIVGRMEHLLALPPNWNAYGAPPVSMGAALQALNVLSSTADVKVPQPQIVPTQEGGLQLEWHLRGIDLEVGSPGSGALLAPRCICFRPLSRK
jgi:hypothetical protein